MIALYPAKGLNALVQGKHDEAKKVFGRRQINSKDNGPFRHSGGRSIRTAMQKHVLQY